MNSTTSLFPFFIAVQINVLWRVVRIRTKKVKKKKRNQGRLVTGMWIRAVFCTIHCSFSSRLSTPATEISWKKCNSAIALKERKHDDDTGFKQQNVDNEKTYVCLNKFTLASVPEIIITHAFVRIKKALHSRSIVGGRWTTTKGQQARTVWLALASKWKGKVLLLSSSKKSSLWNIQFQYVVPLEVYRWIFI